MTAAAERRANRLAHETSPYLLQHAQNPVDWHPWGEEAIRRARDDDRPIFLSIGYSACHWCHVMEHESFEDSEIADLMNRWFVNVKVDREERPDLDQIYMNAVMALTGHGGWPMSVFLTPDLKPFYGGTYWPPESRMGMLGFREILEKIHEAWETRREEIDRTAGELTSVVARIGLPQGERAELAESLLAGAMRALLRTHDSRNGGFGSAPKFPHPMDLRLLLRCWKRFGSDEALAAARVTLDKMARGGIYDHLGGGFHRYATDARWLVPHFEKMLYDNALLVPAYLDAFQATGERDLLRVVRETLDYVLREMTSVWATPSASRDDGTRGASPPHSQPEGGFYSTQDADSEGVEGKFYVWREEEILEHLGPEDARIFNYCYDVTQRGNWEGKNILNRVKTHAEAAKVLGLCESDLTEILERSKRKLLEVRSQRVPPGRDEKVLVSWNGLMIAAMAQAANVLGEGEYAEHARRAADFILENVRTAEGRLLHSYKDGRARFAAYLDDYACLIDGLVELYQAVFDAKYLDAALELAGQMIEHFHDGREGGFFYTADDHEELIARTKDSQDTATPSGNAMAATALLKLARLCGRGDLESKAVETLEMLSGQLAQAPLAGGQSLIALDFLLGPTHEIAIVEGDRRDETDEALAALHERFLPNKVALRRPRSVLDDALPPPLQPLLAGKSSAEGTVTVYICEHGTCGLPAVGIEAFRRALDEMSRRDIRE